MTGREPIRISEHFVATRELFALARARVAASEWRSYAPNDPGHPGYIDAFEAILRDGEPAIHRSFDVTETTSLTRWGYAAAHEEPLQFRWFCILTQVVELLAGYSDVPHYCLAALLVDSFALAAAKDAAAPIPLLSAVCREVGASGGDPRERAFCFLGELVLAQVDQRQPADIEALCQVLDAHDRRYREWWRFENGDWTDQPKTDEFFWSLTSYDQFHSVWLKLIHEHFPVKPRAAAQMKQRLLDGGARWAK